MSGQNTLITCANDNEVKQPSGTLVSRQFYRDKSQQGSGVYKAMDENGNIEIVGGPGVPIPPTTSLFLLDASTGDYWQITISQDGQGNLINTNVGPNPF